MEEDVKKIESSAWQNGLVSKGVAARPDNLVPSPRAMRQEERCDI